MKIKYIIPFPLDAAGVAAKQAHFPAEYRTPGVEYVFAPVKNGTYAADSAYEWAILDAYILEAGLASEDEGFDAVVMDTVSDSGLAALRSRLKIPVLGPGQVQQHVACILGKRFSIVTMWRRWKPMYEKTLREYELGHHCASIRYVESRPEAAANFGPTDPIYLALEAQARAAIEEDGADVLLLGSTTMYKAVPLLRVAFPDVPVLDPGPLALKLAEMLVTLGLTHSKRLYMPPEHLQDEKLRSLTGV